MGDEPDVQGLFRVDGDDGAFLFTLRDVRELLVVLVVAVLEAGIHVRVVVKEDLRDAQRFLHRFDVPLRLGQDDDVLVVALGLEEGEGQGVRNAAVHVLVAVQLDGLCRDGQRRGGTEPFHVLVVAGVESVVDRFDRVVVRRDDPELHRVLPVSLEVEDVVLDRQHMVAEVRVVQVAGGQERGEAAVAGVFREPLVVADDAPGLLRFVVASEGGAGRDADGTVEFHVVFEKDVHDTGGKETAHGAAFKDKSAFHTYISRKFLSE